MEDAEEIENLYEKQMELADRYFIKNLESTKDKKALESEYLEKIKKIRQQYEENYKRYLKIQKQRLSKEKNKKQDAKKEKDKYLKVEPVDLRLGYREKLALKYELFKFRINIKKRKLIHKITPNFFIIAYLKIRLAVKNNLFYLSNAVKKKVRRLIEKTIDKLTKIKDSFINSWLKIKSSVSSILKKIKSKFARKKKEESKTEDQKLAEKILNQKSS